MKTDAFTLIIIFAIVISMITGGIVILITQMDLTSIPSTERGQIASKNIINATDSMIELSNRTTLHIVNNSPLYLSLQENQSYIFNCIFNYNTKITIIQNAQNETTAWLMGFFQTQY